MNNSEYNTAGGGEGSRLTSPLVVLLKIPSFLSSSVLSADN